MISRHQLAQQAIAKVVSVEIFKKKKLKASFFFNSVQFNANDNNLIASDTSDNESESY